MFHIPMSSPMMTRMFGFLACADAGREDIATPASIVSANGSVARTRLSSFIPSPEFDLDPTLAEIARIQTITRWKATESLLFSWRTIHLYGIILSRTGSPKEAGYGTHAGRSDA